MGAEKENIPAASSPKQSNSSDSEEKRLQNEVKCLCSDGDVRVPFALMLQCETFRGMTPICDDSEVEFPILTKLSVVTFNKVVAWMKHRAGAFGKDEPKIEMDPNTHARKWFKLDDFETKFFEAMDVKELSTVVNASDYLRIESLFVFACQSMAAVLKDKPVEELRNFLGIHEKAWLSEKRMAEICEKNAWYKY